MTQTLADLNETYKKVGDDKQVIQSLIKRVDVLESTPDATKEMLAEYVMDFDTLDKTVKSIITGINNYQKDENTVLYDIQRTVKNYHWIINESTLEGLENLVTKKTGFSLQKYVSYVQEKVINAEFNRLHEALTNRISPLTNELEKQNQHFLEQDKKIDYLQNQLSEFIDKQHDMFFFVGIMMCCMIFTGIGFLITAFNSHPIFTEISLVVCLAGFGFLGYFAYKGYKSEMERNEQENDDETE